MSSLGIDLNNNGWTTDSALPSDPPSVSTIPPTEPELNDEARAFSEWIQQHVADAIEAATTPLRIEIDALRNRLATLESSPHAPPAFSAPSRAPSFKVNTPPEFDGSRENGEGFLNACRLYLQLRPDDFPDVSARIGWILSYMTSGRARTWRDTAITHRAMYGGYSWLSEKSFFEAFESEFFPVAESEAALIKLESNGYYQRPSESVDLYVDRFRELVKKANLGNNPSVVVKFRRGLSEQLHRLLSDQPEPPLSLDVEDWIRRSRGLEHSRQVLLRTELSEKVARWSESTRVVPEGFRGTGSDPGASEDAGGFGDVKERKRVRRREVGRNAQRQEGLGLRSKSQAGSGECGKLMIFELGSMYKDAGAYKAPRCVYG